MLDNFFSSQRPLFSLSNRVWNPPTDIYETDTATIVKMEVAGLDEKQLNITAQKNMMIVRGKRIQSHPGIKINYHLMEVHYGAFERVFAFSYNLNQEKIKASYERGFLLIEVGKHDQTTTKVTVKIIQDTSKPTKP